MPSPAGPPMDCEQQVPDEIHKSLAHLILDYGRLEFADACATWRDIERKAQGIVAVSGVFIGGTAALMPRILTHGCVMMAGLALVIAALIGATVFSVLGLRVSQYTALTESSEVRQRAQQVLRATDGQAVKVAIREFVNELAKDISETSAGIDSVNQRKAAWVLAGQVCLAVGVVLGGVVMIAMVFTS
jgi:hypothetical protein